MATNASTAALEQIRVDLIDPNKENPRIHFRQKEMDELMESIAIHGVQVPVISEAKWQAKLDELARYFETIVDGVGSLPVIVHGYDYIVPNGNRAAYDGLHVAGPWIRPMLIKQQVPPEMHRDIVVFMIDSLNNMIASVATDRSSFAHVDLRGTCEASDWASEIHPYESGFATLATKLWGAVGKVLSNTSLATSKVRQ